MLLTAARAVSLGTLLKEDNSGILAQLTTHTDTELASACKHHDGIEHEKPEKNGKERATSVVGEKAEKEEKNCKSGLAQITAQTETGEFNRNAREQSSNNNPQNGPEGNPNNRNKDYGLAQIKAQGDCAWDRQENGSSRLEKAGSGTSQSTTQENAVTNAGERSRGACAATGFARGR